MQWPEPYAGLCDYMYSIYNEILHLAPLGVKPLGAHIRGAIYIVTETCDTYALPIQSIKLPLVIAFTIAIVVLPSLPNMPLHILNLATAMHYALNQHSYYLHYSHRSIAFFPGCASPLIETCDTYALPIQSIKLPLVIAFSLAIAVLPSPPNVLLHLLNLSTAMHYAFNQYSYHWL